MILLIDNKTVNLNLLAFLTDYIIALGTWKYETFILYKLQGF